MGIDVIRRYGSFKGDVTIAGSLGCGDFTVNSTAHLKQGLTLTAQASVNALNTSSRFRIGQTFVVNSLVGGTSTILSGTTSIIVSYAGLNVASNNAILATMYTGTASHQDIIVSVDSRVVNTSFQINASKATVAALTVNWLSIPIV